MEEARLLLPSVQLRQPCVAQSVVHGGWLAWLRGLFTLSQLRLECSQPSSAKCSVQHPYSCEAPRESSPPEVEPMPLLVTP